MGDVGGRLSAKLHMGGEVNTKSGGNKYFHLTGLLSACWWVAPKTFMSGNSVRSTRGWLCAIASGGVVSSRPRSTSFGPQWPPTERELNHAFSLPKPLWKNLHEVVTNFLAGWSGVLSARCSSRTRRCSSRSSFLWLLTGRQPSLPSPFQVPLVQAIYEELSSLEDPEAEARKGLDSPVISKVERNL